jgi:hypothetical protein
VIIFAAVVGSIGNRLGIAIGRRQTRRHAVPPNISIADAREVGGERSLRTGWF